MKHGKSSPIFFLWALVTVLSWLLTFGALIYVFAVTSTTNGQSIDLSVASANPDPTPYPLDSWTPETWYSAVLQLTLAAQDDRDTIGRYLHIMQAWRWNLIPMFVLGFILMDLVLLEIIRVRRSRGLYGRAATKDNGEGHKDLGTISRA
jgi:hypothetical protein